jgi:membrane-bound lytic murein transglycosylase F
VTEVNRYLDEARSSRYLDRVFAAELATRERWMAPHIPRVPDGKLTPWDDLLRRAGRRHGIDWRLLAALMYEESRFNPVATGPGGSAGLFQFMPFTWKALGIENPYRPEDAVDGGARYLRFLFDKFPGVAPSDQVAMAVASYNVGPRHVIDAQRLAEDMDLDPLRWRGNVETAMLLLDDPEVARRYPAGVCRCRRAVNYARRILRRYRAYAEQFPASVSDRIASSRQTGAVGEPLRLRPTLALAAHSLAASSSYAWSSRSWHRRTCSGDVRRLPIATRREIPGSRRVCER